MLLGPSVTDPRRSESADQLLRYLSVNFVTDITYILSKSPMLVN